jgi:Tfp pilus assembly protein PilX
MVVLPSVTAVLLHHNAIDKWTDCNVVSTGLRRNCVSATDTAVLLHHIALDKWTD